MTKRVHLPIVATQPEPAVGQGARSLARWAALKRQIGADPELLVQLRRDPECELARLGLDATREELEIFLASFASSPNS